MEALNVFYESLARVLVGSLPTKWERVRVSAPILGSCCGGIGYEAYDGSGNTISFDIPSKGLFELKENFLKIRDSILKESGQRIWEIQFELVFDGKFKTKFEYTPPNWHDEIDDPLISWEELQIRGRESETVKIPPHLSSDEAAGLSWLQEQTQIAVENWGLGTEKRWDLDIDRGCISWSFENGVQYKASIQVMGTLDSKDGSFVWSWEHPSIPSSLRSGAEKARNWAKDREIESMLQKDCKLDELQLWCWLGIMGREDGSDGGYRVESNGTWIYLTFKAI